MNNPRRAPQKPRKKLNKRSRGTVLPAPIILIFSLGLVGCGVQTYPYLSPPSDSSIVSPLSNEKNFTFYNYTDNNINYFLGYELYYKFYSSSSSNSLYSTELEEIETTPTIDTLNSLGYLRLYNKDDVFSIPLIPVDSESAEQSFAISIDFRFLTETIFPEIKYNDESIYLSRYVQKDTDIQNNVYNFIPEYISSEYDDISGTAVQNSATTVFLSLYVLSYGKYEVFNDLYSKAAHLGKITLDTEEGL